jgi:hypothetical protein
MSNWQQAIVRIWQCNPMEGGTYKGTAFLVGPTYLLTAKHVVQDVPNGDVYVEGRPWAGVQRVAAVQHHPTRDIALLMLERSVEETPWIVLANRDPAINETLTLAGYETTDKELDTPSLPVSSYDGEHHSYVMHTYVARGMSGGPALHDGQLVGITQARDTDRARSYVIPVSAFRDFLRTSLPATEQVMVPSPAPYQLHNSSHITLAWLGTALSEVGKKQGSLDVLAVFGSGRYPGSSGHVGLITDALYLPEIVHDLSNISRQNGIMLTIRSGLDIDILGSDPYAKQHPPNLLTSTNIISIGTGDINAVTAAIFDAFSKSGQKLLAKTTDYYTIVGSKRTYPADDGLGLLSASVNPWNDTHLCLVACGTRTLGTIGSLYLLHLYLLSYYDEDLSNLAHKRLNPGSPLFLMAASPVRIFDAAKKSAKAYYHSEIMDEADLTPIEDIRNVNEDLNMWRFYE